MLLHTVPHWLRVFADRVAEIVIVADLLPPQGRIAALHHGAQDARQLEAALAELAALDAGIKIFPLQDLPPRPIQRHWFGNAAPVRCQAGTPLLAFAAAVDQAGADLVLRCDSDMLFHEAGWLQPCPGIPRRGRRRSV